MRHRHEHHLRMATGTIRTDTAVSGHAHEDIEGCRRTYKLVHGLIVHIGRVGFRNVESIPSCIGDKTEVLLLVANVVLGTSHDTSILDTLDALCKHDTGEDGVWTEAYGSEGATISI